MKTHGPSLLFCAMSSLAAWILSTALAWTQESINLGDIAAGGDGTGTASADVVGINPDTGLLENSHTEEIVISDSLALQPVSDEVSMLIDSVFIIDAEQMPINSEGVTFDFPPGDVIGRTWDHILKDRIGGEDFPVTIGGTAFASGVGIHAAAGITYDLDEIRGLHGQEAVASVTAFAGMGDSPGCLPDPGTVTTYIILSDEAEIIDWTSHRTSVGGKVIGFNIPPTARFLTLATGAGNGQFNCNAGTFGDAFILSTKCPDQGDTHCSGLTVDPPGGPPGTYTASVTGKDDSGDTISYTFVATDGTTTIAKGPQAQSSASFDLTEGVWKISAIVDDDPECADEAGDAACAAVEVSTCPSAGDTHCARLDLEPPAGAPGIYGVTATATDDSGDPVLYTFSAARGAEPPIVRGPQAESSTVFFLTSGNWAISASVDDGLSCPDEALDAGCAVITVTIGEGPEGIDLGDVAAGGDGTGTASPDVVGINPDTGLLENFHFENEMGISDGTALQAVSDDVSPYVDSVFIIDAAQMPINSAGSIFDFPPEDVIGRTWDHILKDRIGGEDTPVAIGGLQFDRGVGIHAAAGITYDLDEIRATHGPTALAEVTAFGGMGDSPGCLPNPGTVTAYIILSDEVEILDWASHRTSVGGAFLRLAIPSEARFLTLAMGAGNGEFYCNSGVFASATIRGSGGPITFKRGDSNADGALNITDGIYTLNFLFLGGPQPPCKEAAEVNDDGSLNITDGIYVLNFLFLGGPAPAAPGHQTCGPDPAESPEDAITCDAFPPCL